MAHPKLASVTRRSLLAAATAALVAGPLAVAGTAQNLETLTDSTTQLLDLTCEQARDTEDRALIEEFCPEEGGDTAPAEETVKSGGDTVTKTVEETSGGTTDDGGSTGTVTDPVAKPGRDQQASGDENVRGISDDGGSRQRQRQARAGQTAGASSTTPSHGYDANGPIRPGMRSYSELTLQPFAAPLVSVPPVYELPQIAQQMFGSTTATGVADPAAATAATAFDGGAASSADSTGWLAATATGLIMLVGAGHALTGGRMPKRVRS